MFVKWKCELCEDVLVSNSMRRHKMDWCSCRKTAMDLEEHYCRYVGKPVEIERWPEEVLHMFRLTPEKKEVLNLIYETARKLIENVSEQELEEFNNSNCIKSLAVSNPHIFDIKWEYIGR